MARKKKAALLGAGFIAESHALALRRARGAKLTAVCDAHLPRAEAFAQGRGVKRVYDSLERMLVEDDCDAVHVLLPPDLHFDATRTILEHDRDVLLEKPMCLRGADCDALIELAQSKNRRLGVNHNFLFLPAYERLRRHVFDGTLGPIDHVTIDWQYPLGQLRGGPFNHWMFRDPANVLFELGPHVAAFLIDVVGVPHDLEVRTTNPIDLPGGARCYRRWQVHAYRADIAIDVNLSLVAGFPNRSVTVRGRAGLARCDYERNLYTLDRATKYGMVFDAYHATRRLGKSLKRQARRNLIKQVGSLGKQAPFGLSICRSVAAFYQPRQDTVDPRQSAEMGRDVIQLLDRIAQAAEVERPQVKQAPPAAAPPTPNILVLGGTGFIGRHLVRQLVDQDRAVRVMTRSAAATGFDDQGGRVEIVEGDIAKRDDVIRALEGVEFVYHLARAYGETWEEYERNDVLVTRQIGECCLEKNIKRLIYTGTIDSYYAGKRNGTITESTGLDPRIERRNDYARAKAAGEAALLDLHRLKSLPVVVMRPGIVIGAGGGPLHWGVGMWPAESVCALWGRGKNKLPLVLVEDVAAALVAALDAEGIDGESFNLIGDPLLSAREYLDACSCFGGMKIQTHPTPVWKYYANDMLKYAVKKAVRRRNVRRPSYRDWASRSQRAVFDCSKAKKMLGWKPTATKQELIERGIAVPMREMMR